jgi:hypothetical protein
MTWVIVTSGSAALVVSAQVTRLGRESSPGMVSVKWPL